MSYRFIKTGLGWFIILSQSSLIGLIFYLEIFSRQFDAGDRSAALTAILPATGAYFGAAVIHLLTGSTQDGTQSKVGTSAVAITFLLPGMLFVAAIIVLELCALGRLPRQTFTDYLGYLQTAQAFVCTTIYLYYFRKELQQYKDLQQNQGS
jgi:hypothetical protein